MLSTFKLGLIGAAVVVLMIVAFMLYNAGREAERDAVNTENTEAGAAANEAAMSRRDCIAAGRVFNFETGKCKRP